MADTCKSCHDPLTLTLDPEDSGDEGSASASNPGETVPDDLVLPCGCHFHWQCLLDHASIVTSTLCCPSCQTSVSSSTTSSSAASSSSSNPQPHQPTQILTHYTNEGGPQPSLDLYPTLLEESFLAAHPEARPARALHTLAAAGEVSDMVGLLTSLDEDSDAEDSEDALSPAQLLVWRDPLNGGRSALHVALEARQEEVVWLLLWLGSAARREDFPDAVVQVAVAMGLPRPDGGEDVRFVRDEAGRTAGDVCLELGEPWTRLVEGGLFV